MSIHVTVGPKPTTHPFYGKGSKQCYYINGVAGAPLNLVAEKEYTFIIDTLGHPFYFTTSESGGSEDNNGLSGFPSTDRGTVKFTIPSSYPNYFYYQCHIHTYMGASAYKSTKQNRDTFYFRGATRELTVPSGRHVYVTDQAGIVYGCDLDDKQSNICPYHMKY